MSRLIDADALINRIVFHTDWPVDEKEAFEDEINVEPTIDPVRKGKWIHKSGTLFATCSECGVVWGAYTVMNYCPNCGAKMEGGD